MIYHDTKFVEARHPHLEVNLLKEQVEACHAAGIRVPIYITVGWDEFQKSVSMSAETTAVLVLAVAATDPEAALTRTETLSSTYLEFRSEQIRSQSGALLDSYQNRLDSLTQRVDALTAEYTAVSSTDPQAQNEAVRA